MKPPKIREDNPMEPGNIAALEWLESHIKYARHRRKENLADLLETVEAEIIFEAGAEVMLNKHSAEHPARRRSRSSQQG